MTVRHRTHCNRFFRFFHGCNGVHEIPTDVPDEEDQTELPNQADQEQVHNNTGQILPAEASSRPHTPQASSDDNNSIQILQPNQNAGSRQNASSDLTENTGNLNQTLPNQDQLLMIKILKGAPIKILFAEKISNPTFYSIKKTRCDGCHGNFAPVLFSQTITQNEFPKNVEVLFFSDTSSNRDSLVAVRQTEGEPSSSPPSRVPPNITSVPSEPQVSSANITEPPLQITSQLQSPDSDATQESSSVDARLQSEEPANHPVTENQMQPLPSLSSTAESVHLSQEPSLPEPSTHSE